MRPRSVRLATFLALTLALAAAAGDFLFPSLAHARPTAPVSASPPSEAEPPPLPYTGPLVSVTKGHLTFFKAIPLGGEIAKVVKAHPAFDWLQIGTTWHVMRPLGEFRYAVIATASDRGRVSMVTIANVHKDRLPLVVAELRASLGEPANPQAPIEAWQWENTPKHHSGNMPRNTRLAILPPGDASPDLYALMAVHLTEPNRK